MFECTPAKPLCSDTEPPSILLMSIAILLGTIGRLMSARVFDNYDMESWWIASEAVQAGKVVYAETHRYNYGPIWSYIIGGLRYLSQLTGPDTITRLHLVMTTFLTVADIGLSLILYRLTSPWIALLFFLNPISTIVTGYHIQFDNLAILLGLIGWLIFVQGTTWRCTLIASLLFGTSLSIKHIFSLFLAWLPFIRGARTFPHRAVFGSVSLALFITSFLPWIDNAEAWKGIQAHVFGYKSTEGHSLTDILASMVPQISPRSLFMALTVVAGVLLMRKPTLHKLAPLVYLIALTSLSSGMARNYLAIPLIGVFFFSSFWASLGYIIVASAALVTVNGKLGVFEVVAKLSSSTLVTYELAQSMLVLLLVQIYQQRSSPLPTEQGPSPESLQTP